jgi:ferritin-like metal-binding protein YciE
MNRSPQEELVHFLGDMYSVEQQALAQLQSAAETIALNEELAHDFRQHHVETQRQADAIERRLDELGGSPSKLKEAIMKVGGKGFLLFAKLQPESPGRLVAHTYSFESMEWAGYQMLMKLANLVGDHTTVSLAQRIAAEEDAMRRRLEQRFDDAEALSHAGQDADQLREQLRKHLAEAHALEFQAIKLCERSKSIGGKDELQATYDQIAEASRQHAGWIEQRLAGLNSSPSTLKDGALRLAGLNWSVFFQAQSDTPMKLAAFVYAFLHLQIAGYQVLQRSAERVGDPDTQRLCIKALDDKQGHRQQLLTEFDAAVRSTLELQTT